MLISMIDAITRALAFEESSPRVNLMDTQKSNWYGFSVRHVLTNPVIQKLLIGYAQNKQIAFPDELPDLEKAISGFVVKEATALIDRDFLPRDMAGVRFSEEQVKQLLAKDHDLLYTLQRDIDDLHKDLLEKSSIEEYLPALVALENAKKPNFDLQISRNEETVLKIEECIKSGKEHGQFLHQVDILHKSGNYCFTYKHADYVDYRFIDGQNSVLWIDSYCFDDKSGEFQIFSDQLRTIDSDIAFAGVELRTQSDAHNCHTFALNMAKQAYRDPKSLDALHRQSIASWEDTDRKLADELVPPSLFKHTQSGKRLLSYFYGKEGVEAAAINNKGDTLAQYRGRHFLEGSDGEARMRSIYQKRLESLVELREAFGMPAGKGV